MSRGREDRREGRERGLLGWELVREHDGAMHHYILGREGRGRQ